MAFTRNCSGVSPVLNTVEDTTLKLRGVKIVTLCPVFSRERAKSPPPDVIGPKVMLHHLFRLNLDFIAITTREPTTYILA